MKLVRLRVNNFEKFKEINFENLGLNKIYSQFKIEEKQTSSLSHKFTDLNNVKKFETFEEDSFEFDQNQDEKIIEILQSHPIFFTFSCINKIYSKSLIKIFTNSEKMKKFVDWTNNIYDSKFENMLHFSFLRIILLNNHNYIKILQDKDEKFLHMFMHSFILMSISFNSIGNNNYFSKLNLNNIFDFLEENYILGSELKDCGQLESNYKILVDHHSNYPDKGAYLCNCQQFYIIENCGNC